MTDTTQLTDEEIRALLSKATDGPWRIVDCQNYGDRSLNFYQEVWSEGTDILVTTEVTRAHNDGGRANVRLIAAAPDLARLALERGAECDAFRAVLEGAEYRDIDGISKQSTDTNRALGREIARSTKQVIDKLNATLARAEAAEAERDRLLPWANLGAAVMEPWPEIGDLDGFQIHDMAVGAGVLREIPGGYNSDLHCDSVGVDPEPGDPWFECVNLPAALNTQEEANAPQE